MVKFEPETAVTPASQILFRDLEDEAVILNLETGVYYGLDSVGARFWVLISEMGRLGKVHAQLKQEYEAAESELWRDLINFVEKLQQEGLIEVG